MTDTNFVLGPGALDGVTLEQWVADSAAAAAVTIEIPVATNDELLVPLLLWLADLRRRGVQVRLAVRTTRGGQLEAVARELLGSLLVLYASEVRLDSQLVERHDDLVFDSLRQAANEIADATSSAVVVTNAAPKELLHELNRHHLFSGTFLAVQTEAERMVASLGYTLPPSDMEQLTSFIYQAVDNARQHGYLDRRGNPIVGARYVRLRVVHASLRDHANDVGQPLTDYLSRLSERLGDEDQTLLEVTVADPGRGIAATMASDDNVFTMPLDYERTRFSLALVPGGTSQKAAAGVGRGLVIMSRAIHGLRGFMFIRTGRLSVWRHFLNAAGESDPPIFDETDHSLFSTFDWTRTGLSRVTGTLVAALLPLERRD